MSGSTDPTLRRLCLLLSVKPAKGLLSKPIHDVLKPRRLVFGATYRACT